MRPFNKDLSRWYTNKIQIRRVDVVQAVVAVAAWICAVVVLRATVRAKCCQIYFVAFVSYLETIDDMNLSFLGCAIHI